MKKKKFVTESTNTARLQSELSFVALSTDIYFCSNSKFN